MAFLGHTRYEMKKTGTRCQVPDNPKAKLMYYLNCMCTVLQLDDLDGIRRLRQHDNYNQLTRSETAQLILLCGLLNPSLLLNKCIFQDDELCDDSSNEFYELSAVKNQLMFAGNIMIGGKSRRVSKIMAFKKSWLEYYPQQPLQQLAR